MVFQAAPQPQQLKALAATLSYAKWQDDVKNAEDAFEQESSDCRKILRMLKMKQKVHEGDRNHPRLVALDELSLNYPGWEADHRDAVKYHCEEPYYAASDFLYRSKLQAMKRRQQLFLADSSLVTAMYTEQSLPDSDQSNVLTSDSLSETSMSSISMQPTPQQSTKGNSALGTCVICCESAKSHVIVPCGHLSLCGGCAPKVERRQSGCPICRGRIVQIFEVFF